MTHRFVSPKFEEVDPLPVEIVSTPASIQFAVLPAERLEKDRRVPRAL